MTTAGTTSSTPLNIVNVGRADTGLANTGATGPSVLLPIGLLFIVGGALLLTIQRMRKIKVKKEV
jgi:LPXTG-motif cell wall-anchored protein